jgi:hypothetical protein
MLKNHFDHKGPVSPWIRNQEITTPYERWIETGEKDGSRTCPEAATQPEFGDQLSQDQKNGLIRTQFFPRNPPPGAIKDTWAVLYYNRKRSEAEEEIRRQQYLISKLGISALFDKLITTDVYKECFSNREVVYAVYETKQTRLPVWLNPEKFTPKTGESIAELVKFLTPIDLGDGAQAQAYWVDPVFELDAETGSLVGLNPENLGISGIPGPDGRTWTADEARVYMASMIRELGERLLYYQKQGGVGQRP